MEKSKQVPLEVPKEGQILEGRVKSIADYGVTVDLGVFEGFVHVTNLSWGRIGEASEIVKPGQKINVVVLDYDSERKQVLLGYKQLQPYPWETIETKYAVGMKVVGRVVYLTGYGAFIEIEKGIEGIIHISEMSWTQHIKHPSQVVSMGQIVETIIISLSKVDENLLLSIKQLEPESKSRN